MSIIDLSLLDNSNNTKEEMSIIKPKSYKELIVYIRFNLKGLPDYFEIFILDQNNKEIKIDNEDKYKLTEDILFIREIDKDKNKLDESIFDINYNKLSELEKEKLDYRYNCILCTILIKNEKPYFCYNCQNIFHEKCLKEWDKQCKLQNKNLVCPNCRNALPIEKWHKKLDYEDNRKDDANLINQVKELKDNEIIHYEIIKKYEKYIEKTIKIFKDILIQINTLHNLLKLEKNNIINNLINAFPLSIQYLNIDGISDLIEDELNKFINHINNHGQINLYENKNEINFINKHDNIKKNKEIQIKNKKALNEIPDENEINIISEIINKQKIKMNENKNSIIFKHFVKSDGVYDILGEKFIENNKNNIELIINDKKSNLINKAELKKGENIVKLIIKNKLSNFSHMFHLCKTLKNIDGLKNLDVSESKDLSYMFYKCSSLSDISALNNWDVSNCNNFEYMFFECVLISDINPLKDWKVFNGKDFGSMFYDCSTLSDISPLKDWNVFNSNYFTNMFRGCSSLKNIKALENWNVSNCKDFTSLFSGCRLLSDISPLRDWDVSNSNTLQGMFFGCSSLSDLKPLQDWNVANCHYFINMFYGCISLINIEPLKNWNISKDKRYNNMFYGCPILSDINQMENFKNLDKNDLGIKP